MKNIKALVEKVKGKLIAVASDDSVDRHGDSINQDAWDLKQFRKNPVLLMAHQYDRPPVGIVKNIRRDDNTLTFEPVFHEITQEAREVKKMYLDGIMRAFSVGFMQKENKKGDVLKNELLEISAVPVPANGNALVFAKSVSEKTVKDIDKWIKEKSVLKKKSLKNKKEFVDKEEFNELFSVIKDINIRLNDITKGRQEPAKADTNQLVVRGLEKLNNQLGYLKRKSKKG